MACKNMTEAFLEDVIEITWVFDRLIQSEEIKPWDEIVEQEYGSVGIKNVIKNIAQEFEKTFPFETAWEDSDMDYIEEIEKFARAKLMELYGTEKKYCEYDSGSELDNSPDVKQFIEENSVSEGYLSDWYQASVTDAEPVWTDEHIAEVHGDFYMIPKEVVDRLTKNLGGSYG